MMFKTVLFDFDYTLADSSEGAYECVNYALKKMNLPAQPFSTVCKTIGLSLSDTFLNLTNNNDPTNFKIFKDLFIERADQVMADRTVVFNGVAKTLNDLISQKMLLGIVSTKFRYRISSILRRENLLHHFDVIIGGEDVVSHKPDPEGLMMALSKLSVSHSECLYVGDSRTDGELAKHGNDRFAAVCSGATKRTEFEEFKPFIICESVNQLPELIFSNI